MLDTLLLQLMLYGLPPLLHILDPVAFQHHVLANAKAWLLFSLAVGGWPHVWEAMRTLLPFAVAFMATTRYLNHRAVMQGWRGGVWREAWARSQALEAGARRALRAVAQPR